MLQLFSMNFSSFIICWICAVIFKVQAQVQFPFSTWCPQSNSGSNTWEGFALSSDGSVIVALRWRDYIMTSTDAGLTWTSQTNSGQRGWYGVSMSADGSRIAAASFSDSAGASGGFIYTSSDYGVTWTARATDSYRSWKRIAGSSDLTKLAAINMYEYVYTSIDSGLTWTLQRGSGSRTWYGIASSADGVKLAAVENGGFIYTSADSGVTWTARATDANRYWADITSSSDGTKLAATDSGSGGYIYTSTDSGATWTAQAGSGQQTWGYIAGSADGNRLAALLWLGSPSYVYVSIDSGINWSQMTNSGAASWYQIGMNAGGQYVIAGPNGNVAQTSNYRNYCTCPAGFYCPYVSYDPIVCPAGFYCPAGASAEQPCRAGTYLPTVGGTSAASCLICAGGTNTGSGSTACTAAPTARPTSTPTAPTGQPSGQPSRQPSGQPTGQPSREPTGQPTGQPSEQPSSQPSGQPSGQPTSQPSHRTLCVKYGLYLNASIPITDFQIALNATIHKILPTYNFYEVYIPLEGSGPSLCALSISLPPNATHRDYAGAVLNHRSTAGKQESLLAVNDQVVVFDMVVGSSDASINSMAAEYQAILNSIDNSMNTGLFTSALISSSVQLNLTALIALRSALALIHPYYTHYPTGQPTGQPSGQPTSQPTLQPPPKLTLAQFENSGGGFNISFNTATDEAYITNNSWPCAQLFSFSGVSACSCSWLSPSLVKVTIPYLLGTIVAGDFIGLNNGQIRRQCATGALTCSHYLVSNGETVALQNPVNPVAPVVYLSSSNMISSCDDITIDATATRGSANRAWQRIQWSVSVDSGLSNYTALIGILNSRGNDITSPITLPNDFLSHGQITVSLLATNYFNKSSSGSISVVITTDRNVPSVTIIGQAPLSLLPFQVVTVEALGQVSSCADSPILAYEWVVTDAAGAVVSDTPSQSVNVHVWRSLPYTLLPLSNYTLTSVVRSFDLTSQSNSSIQLVATSGGVRTVIAGAAVRDAAVGAALVLDGSASYDENYSPSYSSLQYSWRCSYFDQGGAFVSDCATLIAAQLSSPVVNITQLPASLGFYSFVLVCTQPLDGRSANTSVRVRAVAPSVPLLTLVAGSLLASPGSLASIEASILASVPVRAYWRDTAAVPLDLLTVNQSQISRDFTAAECQANIGYNLILDTTSLISGKVYRFQLSAVSLFDSSAASTATVTVQMRLPPSSGGFSVSPASGLATSTVFTMLAFGWIADGGAYPLSFDYRYQLAGASTYQVLQLKIAKSYIFSTLPAGFISENSAVNVLLRVYDSYSTQSSTSASVQVFEEAAIDISYYLLSNLVNTTLSLDYYATLKLLNHAGTLYSLTGCSGAPDCSSLNRASCVSSGVPQTCGSCLTNFLGIDGPSNTPCAAQALALPGDACASSGDCLFANCVNSICGALNKTCPTSISGSVCSGHGSCEMVDFYGTPLEYCAPYNVSCNAACACTAGFSGHSCNTTIADASARGDSVSLICNTTLTLLDSFDHSTELLEGLFGALDLAFNSYEVNSTDALLSCLSSAVNISRAAFDLLTLSKFGTATVGRAYSLLSSLSLSTSKAVGGANITRQSDDPYGTQIDSYLSHMSSSVLNQLLPGQAPVHVAASNVQISLYNSFLDDVSNKALSPGGSGATGAFVLGGVSLQSCEAYSNGFASFAVSQFNAIPFPQSGAIKGPLTRWYTTGAVSTGGAATVATSAPYYLLLPFFNKQVLTPHYNRFFNATLPDCVSRSGEGYVSCKDCVLDSYTNDSAVFRCASVSHLCPSSASGPVADLGSFGDIRSTLLDYSVVVHSIEAEILSVFSAQNIDWATAGGVIAIVAILFLVYFGGAIYFMRWDNLDRKMLIYAYIIPNSDKMKHASGGELDSLRSRVNDMFLSGVGPQQNTEFIELVEADREYDRRTLSIGNIFYPIYVALKNIFKLPKVLIEHRNLLEADAPGIRFLQGLLRFHPFLSFYFGPSMVKTRMLRWTSFFKSFLISLFTSTLIFGIYYPFNETCSIQTSEATCLSAPSKLVSGQSECSWELNYDSGFSKCSLRPPPNTFNFVVFVAVVTSLISLPFDLLISFLLLRVCNRSPDFSLLFPPLCLSAKTTSGPEKRRDSQILQRENKLKASINVSNESIAISYVMRTLRVFVLEWTEGHMSEFQIENMKSMCRKMGVLIEKEEIKVSLWHRFRGRNLTDVVQIYVRAAMQRGETLFNEILGITETLHLQTRDESKKKLFESNVRDTLLMHRFVSEMIDVLSRSILAPRLDDYSRTFPSPIHPLKWLLAWAVVIGLILFFIVWILLWGVQNTGLTFSNWIVNFIIETLHGCLVSSTLRVLAVHLLLLSWVRPKIQHTVSSICNFAESLEKDTSPAGETYLFQAISPSCYAAKLLRERSDDLSLPAVIQRLSDEDIALLRDAQLLTTEDDTTEEEFGKKKLSSKAMSFMKRSNIVRGALRSSSEYLIEI